MSDGVTTTATTPSRAELVERAAVMRPILEQQADTPPAPLPDTTVQALKDGLCRLMAGASADTR